MINWQPISQAPRDGRLLRLQVDERVIGYPTMALCLEARWDVAAKAWAYGTVPWGHFGPLLHEKYHPTHFSEIDQ